MSRTGHPGAGTPPPYGRRTHAEPQGDRRRSQRTVTARGYAATSLADVAAAAGVARPTVFAAFGSKPGLLHQVLDEALAGDDEPVPVASRPWFRPVLDAPTQDAVLGAYAQVCTLIGGRAARSFEAVRRAPPPRPRLVSCGTPFRATAAPGHTWSSGTWRRSGLWGQDLAPAARPTSCGFSTIPPTTTPSCSSAAGRSVVFTTGSAFRCGMPCCRPDHPAHSLGP